MTKTCGKPVLTEREMEALTLSSEGLGDKMIAARMGISPRTAEMHLQSARRKLGAATTKQAVRIATEHELFKGVTL